ncbi:hypothetical protein C8Q80DRAFT_1093731 [Daedaleopsis nitida]|nr:hypothetical protein C8Q80DRAFT_1093731 [Daedaleopsis nitida]
MSSTGKSAKLVVILGGTGDLGFDLSTVFLTEYHDAFPTVRITTRDQSTPKAQQLASKGAQLHAFGESLDTVLAGADVVVNALPMSASATINKELTASLVKNGVKVYFPSEFGADTRTVHFPGFEHPEWPDKRAAQAEVRTATQGRVKVVALITGVFMSWLFDPTEPFPGIDVPRNTFRCLGSPATKFATTHPADVGRAVARLSLLALDPDPAAAVPDVLRIAGQLVSMEDIRDAVARGRGVLPGSVVSEDLGAVKDALRANYPGPLENIADYVRVDIGEGNMNFVENSNELVNPGERLWKWKNIEECVREM